ncbi:4'-phosphopantetheinyl transferase family protein [Pontiella agarivorans]|uniref:4'-phosphopantetheinyl transferase superfamily protein n=1 Tax=Pontiella agarivorans TaxID=3038953 RepID=A0ABU5MUB4_9BACT|nr:4'-phosphopantetheinyl transferase superfamily protein [Pontiella agarivorans]MDZ8117722.1 4'-phosphopantetheinyl transferase superfamily protein [Pontiella agarivorans]
MDHIREPGFLFAQNSTFLHHAGLMKAIDQLKDIPVLGTSDIHIWGAEVPRCLGKLQALEKVLCREEREKADRFRRETDRNSSIVARGALRILLAAYTGYAAPEISFGYSKNGKPFLVSPASGAIGFNVSHSGDWVVLAFGRERQVGVDVEKIRREMDVLSIASRYFTPEETRRIEAAEDVHGLFFHHWARKEAYVKAIGSGLFRELSSFSVPNEEGEKDGWFFQRLEAGSRYAAAVVTDKAIGGMPCFDFGGLNWVS